MDAPLKDRLLKVPEDFFFDRTLQVSRLGIAFDVRQGNLQYMETRRDSWSVGHVGPRELK
jgi:hypothetical protein